MADESTPRPWIASDDLNSGGGCNIFLVSHPTIRVCHTAAVNSPVMLKKHAPIKPDEAAANAALIVRAVNRDHLFSELTRLIRDAIERGGCGSSMWLEDARAVLKKVGTGHG